MAEEKRKIEIFTAGCPVCEPVVAMVQELACDNCEVHVHDLNTSCETGVCREEAQRYGITRVPTVVVNGKSCSCCETQAVNRDDLRAAGIGQPL